MPTLPMFLQGYGATTLAATPLKVNAAGVLSTTTGGSTETLVGVVDEFSYQGRAQTETINALTSRWENEVVVEQVDMLTIGEILGADDSGALGAYSVLPKIWAFGGTDVADEDQYVKFDVVRGPNSYTFYGLLQELSKSYRHGKCTARLTMQMIDIDAATANPAFA